MVVVGLTGSLSTGKSTVAEMFKQQGAIVFNADQVAHDLLKNSGKCFKPVIRLLGKSILNRGTIDRKKVAAIVFKDKNKLTKLEHIIHPAVRKEMIKKINLWKKQSKKRFIILDIPLLFESKLNRYVDITVVVKASLKNQITRAQKRLNITHCEALRRIKAQMPLSYKIKLSDHVINNNGEKKQTKKQVKKLCQELQHEIRNQ